MATRRVELRAHFARTTSASAGAAAAAMIKAINRLCATTAARMRKGCEHADGARNLLLGMRCGRVLGSLRLACRWRMALAISSLACKSTTRSARRGWYSEHRGRHLRHLQLPKA